MPSVSSPDGHVKWLCAHLHITPGLNWLSKRLGFRRRRSTGERRVHYASRDCPNKRRNPEEPELPEGPATNKNCWTSTPSRVHRHVGDRDANQVNQCQSQTDGNRRESLRCTLVRAT